MKSSHLLSEHQLWNVEGRQHRQHRQGCGMLMEVVVGDGGGRRRCGDNGNSKHVGCSKVDNGMIINYDCPRWWRAPIVSIGSSLIHLRAPAAATSSVLPHLSLLLLLLLPGLFPVVEAIKINRFQVPEAVERGKPAVLFCDYSLDPQEELYSIKFYKNNVEFYRFVPGEVTPKISYKMNGIHVNLAESNWTHAVLSKTNLNSDGLYVCEISTEAPIFSTVRSEQLMKIYVLPRETLQIHGVREQYNYGDNISLACKAGRSWPAGKLEWYINDSPVESRYVRNVQEGKSSNGLVATQSMLNIQARPNYFRNGVLEIKCAATMTIVYEYDTTEHLVTGSFKNKSVNRIPVWRKEWPMQANVKTPTISGMRKNYLINDVLKLNCSTSTRNARLKWYIMEREANETNLMHFEYNGRSMILGLWLKMEKRLIQMPELRLRCLSYYPKQIAQFNAKLKIRTYDTKIWQTEASGSQMSGSYFIETNQPTFVLLLLLLIRMALFL